MKTDESCHPPAEAGRVAALLLGATILAAAAVLTVHAQTFRGAIVGTVIDQSQAPAPDVKVTAKNQATGLTRTASTDTSGNYDIPELPLGDYTVTLEKEGFETVTQADVRVDVAAERRIDVTLVPGKVQQTVEVTAAAPLIQSTTNVLGGTIEGPQAENLPVNGRDYTKLIYMVPGVTGSPDQITDSPGSFGVFSVNGARGRSNNFLLDGTDMNDGYRNDPTINQAGVFGTPATILPVDAVAELAVLSNFMPEYGRNAGAVINIVTKSGTNDFHGTAADYFRNNALDARNFFNPGPTPKTSFHNNQFGGSLGGPIIRDKTFFFGDYEGQRETGGLNSLACVPSVRQIVTAAQGITVNPVIAALLARHPWPAPNLGGEPFGNCPNLSATTHIFNSVNSAIAKIDHSINDSNLVTGRYYYGTSIQSFPLGLQGGNNLPGYNTLTPTNINLVSLSWVDTLSTTRVNELRVGYNRFAETFFPEDRSFDPSSIGLNTGVGKQDFGLPFIAVSGFAPIGGNTSLPRGRVDYNYQLIDNFSWKLNRHEFKFGYEFRRTPITQFFDENYRGKIKFGSLGDFLQGIPSGGRQAEGNSYRNSAQNSHAWYVQDSFRWSRQLTLNYGVRWDYYGVIHEKHNLMSNFDPAVGLEQVGSSSAGLPTISRLYEPDYNNFAPRFSLAYDVRGDAKTVVRAGWGVFYDVFSQDFFLGQLPFNTFNPGPAYNGVGRDPILFSFSPTSQIQAGQPVFSGFAATDVFAVDRHVRTPYMENYNLNLEQQISNRAVLQVGYVGSIGRKLFRYRDINQPTPATIAAQTSICDGCVPRPFNNGPFPPSPPSPAGTTFFYVNQIETTANSSYNSLQTSLRIRGFRGLESTINYTYGHSIDNASDGQDFVANATQPNNSYAPKLEKGNSNFDVRHRFVWLWTFTLPTWKGRWPKLTDGWGINGVLTLQSGQPFHLNLTDDYDGTGEFFPRPDLVGNPYAGVHSPDNFLNLSAFAVPCAFLANPNGDGLADQCVPGTQHTGTLGRNSLFGPNFRQFDFSIFKNTPITEKLKVQLRAEFYNLPNHPNFASPLYPGFEALADNNGIDPVTGHGIGFLPLTETGDVGVGNPFLGGGGPRGIQLALKFMF
ncbi:MAG TPA: TonB-dependent receptor [Terriglobia bacterium]|nr:TonB-dependent receptor [Terriglobia bacterium]